MRREGGCRPEITPPGIIILIVLPVRATYHRGDQLALVFRHLDPIYAEIGVLRLPFGKDPGPEPVSVVGGVGQSDERLLLPELKAPNEVTLRYLRKRAWWFEVSDHLVEGALGLIPSGTEESEPILIRSLDCGGDMTGFGFRFDGGEQLTADLFLLRPGLGTERDGLTVPVLAQVG